MRLWLTWCLCLAVLATTLPSVLIPSVGHCAAAPALPRMRPYAGIGVVQLSAEAQNGQAEPLPLYREPALSRLLDAVPHLPSQEWIFGPVNHSRLLIVMAKKGEWLRVVYDDAGREAWIQSGRRAPFQPWDQFLKGQPAWHLLPGLQKRFYQLLRQRDAASGSTLTSRQAFKVLRVEGDWVLAMPDQNSLGWLRWRDEDGRLLVGQGRP